MSKGDETPANKPSILRTIRGKQFAERLRDILLEKNISQSDLSRMSNLGRDSISGYIRGKSIPSPESVDKLAKALQIKREELQPSAYRATLAPGKPMLSMRAADPSSETTWLTLHQKMPTALALQIISMIKAERKG